ncbi:MFS transporter [Actinomadura parmotrematis]|uniref:MFS transporter n=1 Tax=Actinomadura parmotrematis TaxID=2864039 RepID=A0ABS7G456_9ACTN|nr:MFS transporter [Actinomadura parmotrematis]MBW8487503.1 MFS transporter [Actinomadura parmotrematis]
MAFTDDSGAVPGPALPGPAPVPAPVPAPAIVAAPPPASLPARAGRWNVASLGLAMFGLYTMFMGALALLLPRQVERITGGDGKVTVLGAVTGIAAVVAAAAQPVAGHLSDRTRSRLGRRNAWVLGGGVAAAALIAPVGRIGAVPLLVLAWSAVQAAGNAMQAGVTAALAERVPVERRGTASGAVGLAMVLGMVAGPAVAGIGGYPALAGVVLAASLLFVATTRDRPAPAPAGRTDDVPDAGGAAPGVRRDFWWGFASRASLFLAYAMVGGYALYMLQDYAGVPDDRAEGKVALLNAALGAGVIVMAPLAGYLADRAGRLKPFVIVAAAGFLPAFAVMYAAPSTGGLAAGFLLVGVAFGSYLAVDQALLTRVLPGADRAGLDLGVLNIAAAGPQIAAPFAAGLVIAHLGGYRALFLVGAALAVAGALAVAPIRSVR